MKPTSHHKDPASAYAAFIDGASPRRKAALDAIFAAGNAMLEEGAHITVVSVGARTQAMPGGPTSRTIYNTPNPYGALVQTFVEAQSAQKPGLGFAEQSGHHLPSLESIIDAIADPAQKAVLRTFEHEAQRARDRLRILESFVAKVTAQDVAQMTGSDMVAQRRETLNQGKPASALPGSASTGTAALSDEDRSTIRAFFADTLFDEGYEHHDGDLFHAQSGRSLRAEAFVALMQRLGALSF
jgi:hypothetical protein